MTKSLLIVALIPLLLVPLVNAQNSTLGNNLMNQLKLAQSKITTEFPQKTDTQKIIDLLTNMNTTLAEIQKDLQKWQV